MNKAIELLRVRRDSLRMKNVTGPSEGSISRYTEAMNEIRELNQAINILENSST